MTNTLAILLVALAQVESNNNDHARGKAGEVSRYQILKPYWFEVTNSRNWTSPVQARAVAEHILSRRIDTFVRSTGRLPKADEVYALWNKPGWFAARGWDVSRLPAVTRARCNRYKKAVEKILQNRREEQHPQTNRIPLVPRSRKAVDKPRSNTQ